MIPILQYNVLFVGDPYTTMCDVFSFAITMWEMLARKVPTIDLGTSNLNSFAILYQMAQGQFMLYD